MSDRRTFIYVTRDAAANNALGALAVRDCFSCKVEEISPAGVWYRRGDDGSGPLDFLPSHSVRTITGLEPRRQEAESGGEHANEPRMRCSPRASVIDGAIACDTCGVMWDADSETFPACHWGGAPALLEGDEVRAFFKDSAGGYVQMRGQIVVARPQDDIYVVNVSCDPKRMVPMLTARGTYVRLLCRPVQRGGG